MRQWLRRSSRHLGRSYVTKLRRVRHDAAGDRTNAVFGNGLPAMPNGDGRRLDTDLYRAAGQGWMRWYAIEHTIIRDIAIPTDLALFGPKALPGETTRQCVQLFIAPAVQRAG